MSYSAYVVCRCWQDKKTKTPPHKVLFDGDGFALEIPYPVNGTSEERDLYSQMYSELESWKQTACPHKDMYFIHEYLCNISGMENFRYFIESASDDRFAALKEYLPIVNGGLLPANAAGKALQELEDIENCNQEIQKTILQEASEGHLIFSVNNDISTIFCWGEQIQYCLDRYGFFVIENKEHIIFSSKHFIQEPLPDRIVKFTDIPSGKSIEKQGGGITVYPHPLSKNEFVITYKNTPVFEEYSYITIPLRKLLMASLETGNPIHWT